MSFYLVGAVVLSAVVGVTAERKATAADKIELKRQADEEKLSAEGQEIERRQRLNKVLAANIVGQASSGISGEGTPESIALGSAKKASASEGNLSPVVLG